MQGSPGCKIEGEELRAITVPQLDAVVAHIERRCEPEGWQNSRDQSKFTAKTANLYAANLSSADLSDANLYDANLSYAILYDAVLTGANLTGVTWTGALIENCIGCPCTDANNDNYCD